VTKRKTSPQGQVTPPNAGATSGDVAARQKWLEWREWLEVERRLSSGVYTLEDALMITLRQGVRPSPWLIAHLEDAFTEHREGRRQLADSFGSVRAGNDAQAITAELVNRQCHDLVLELHNKWPKGSPQHLPLTVSSARTKKAGSTAFKRAGEVLKMPEATVRKHYLAGKKLVSDDSKG